MQAHKSARRNVHRKHCSWNVARASHGGVCESTHLCSNVEQNDQASRTATAMAVSVLPATRGETSRARAIAFDEERSTDEPDAFVAGISANIGAESANRDHGRRSAGGFRRAQTPRRISANVQGQIKAQDATWPQARVQRVQRWFIAQTSRTVPKSSSAPEMRILPQLSQSQF